MGEGKEFDPTVVKLSSYSIASKIIIGQTRFWRATYTAQSIKFIDTSFVVSIPEKYTCCEQNCVGVQESARRQWFCCALTAHPEV